MTDSLLGGLPVEDVRWDSRHEELSLRFGFLTLATSFSERYYSNGNMLTFEVELKLPAFDLPHDSKICQTVEYWPQSYWTERTKVWQGINGFLVERLEPITDPLTAHLEVELLLDGLEAALSQLVPYFTPSSVHYTDEEWLTGQVQKLEKLKNLRLETFLSVLSD